MTSVSGKPWQHGSSWTVEACFILRGLNLIGLPESHVSPLKPVAAVEVQLSQCGASPLEHSAEIDASEAHTEGGWASCGKCTQRKVGMQSRAGANVHAVS